MEEPVKKVSYFDSRLTQPNNTFGIRKSNQNILYNKQPASSESNSAVQFDFVTDKNTFISRNIKVRSQIKVTLAGTSSSGNLLNIGSTDAPRFQLLNNCLWQTVQLTLNGKTLTQNNNSFFEPLSRFRMGDENFTGTNTGSPSMHDMAQDYTSVIGKTRNSLGDQGDATEHSEIARGGFSGITVVSNSPTAAVVIFDVIESVFLPGLSYSKYDSPALVGINTIKLYITYAQSKELERVLSHNAVDGNTITSIQVQIGNDAGLDKSEIYFQYIQAPTLYPLDLNSPRRYPYSELTAYTNTGLTLASGATASNFTVPYMQLSFIPNRIWIFARDRVGVRDASTPDTYASITRLGVQFGNSTTSLSNASQLELYMISLANGLNMQYSDFVKNVGSIICLAPGRDFALERPDVTAPGSLNQSNIQFTLDFKNTSLVSRTYDIIVIVENCGYMQIKSSVVETQLNVVRELDVVQTPVDPRVKGPSMDDEIFAGGIVEDFFDIVRDGVKFGETLYEKGRKIAPLIGGSMLDPPTMAKGGRAISRTDLSKYL